MRLVFVIIFFLLSVSCAVFASDIIPVRNIGLSEGLSNNSSTSIIQDKFGYIWIGTFDGLNRYDGFEFKGFRNKWQDSTSLINNHIVSLSGSDKGVWVGTLKGVSFFDYGNQKFQFFNYQPYNKKKIQKLEARSSEILVIRDTVYLCTDDKGFLVLKPNTKLFTQIPLDRGLSDYNVQGICEYNGTIYLFIKNVGLCLFDKQKQRIRLLSNAITEGGKLLSVPAQGVVFIGSQNGLFQYNLRSGKMEKSLCNNSLRVRNITGLLLSKEEQLWIATDGGGVAIFNLKDNQVNYIVEGNAANQLKSGAVYAIFEDKNYRKWIATLRGGVSIVDSQKPLFVSVRKDPFAAKSLVSNFVLSFCEDKTGDIWIGTDGGGLSKWNPVQNSFSSFVHEAQNRTSLGSNFVVSLLIDHKNRLWVATFGGGIQLMDRATGKFINYPCYNPTLKEDDINFWKLFQDRENRLWAGATRGGAMYLFNEALNKWEIFDSRLTNIHAINQDKDGRIWAGNYKELIGVDNKTKQHVHFPINYPILCVYIDHKNRIWLGSEGGGLILFNSQKQIFKHFTELDGLPANTILNVLEDNSGNLWLSTYNGLSRFNPDTKVVENFTVNDGLQSNEFNYNAALKLANGQLIFGGINGFNMFNPKAVVRSSNGFEKPMITAISINKVAITQTSYWPKGLAVENINAIVLPFKEANLDISFVAINFSASEKVQYGYFLEGWDKDWNQTTTGTLTYNNLSEGDYVLHIKSKNGSGVWAEALTQLKITILPPWYRSWWAWLLYATALVFLSYSYLRYKSNRQKLKFEEQLARVTAQKEKDLSEKKASFFTNITHEFRTLLTLIINPINELMHHKDSEEETPVEIKVAYNNSRRMLRLVDQLLLFRKVNANATVLHVGKHRISTLCKDVFDSFYYQARASQIRYEFSCEIEDAEIFVDPEKIEIAIFNLISNALKYTPEKGSVKLEIQEKDASIVISISDSGSGIDKNVGNRIFDQYYQVKSLESKSKPGFGIGLYLVKNFIDLHGGKLHYETGPGIGTVFFMELLKGKAHFTDNVAFMTDAPEKQIAKEIISVDIDLPSPDSTPKPEEIISEKKTVLIVDDNEKLVQYLKSIFTEGYHVLVSFDGADAYKQSIKSSPDIIITDLNMPGETNGHDLCVKIKTNNQLKHIPIILLTGEDSPEVRLQCIKSGAEDYVLKPFEKELLLAKVANLVTSKANLQQYFLNRITLKGSNINVLESEKLFLDQCIQVVENHLYDEQFAINILAKEMGKSHSALYKKIKLLSGHTVNSFVRMIRLRKAAELLINSNCNVTEAATQAGFNDMKHFRAQFLKIFNCTPSEYIKKYRRQFQKSYTIDRFEKRDKPTKKG
jgi:signal transduction histidine kinase/ligand-binding sensor domain-containing protein/DNA-binding response OmpR family regulator